VALAVGVQMPQRARPGTPDAARASRWLRREYLAPIHRPARMIARLLA